MLAENRYRLDRLAEALLHEETLDASGVAAALAELPLAQPVV